MAGALSDRPRPCAAGPVLRGYSPFRLEKRLHIRFPHAGGTLPPPQFSSCEDSQRESPAPGHQMQKTLHSHRVQPASAPQCRHRRRAGSRNSGHRCSRFQSPARFRDLVHRSSRPDQAATPRSNCCRCGSRSRRTVSVPLPTHIRWRPILRSSSSVLAGRAQLTGQRIGGNDTTFRRRHQAMEDGRPRPVGG